MRRKWFGVAAAAAFIACLFYAPARAASVIAVTTTVYGFYVSGAEHYCPTCTPSDGEYGVADSAFWTINYVDDPIFGYYIAATVNTNVTRNLMPTIIGNVNYQHPTPVFDDGFIFSPPLQSTIYYYFDRPASDIMVSLDWLDHQHAPIWEGFGVEAGVQFSIDVYDVPPVPLPATFPLFATGLGALGLIAHRRSRRS